MQNSSHNYHFKTAEDGVSRPHREDGGRLTLSVEECAEMLGVGKSVIYKMIREKTVPFSHMRFGRTIKVSRKSFNEYLRSIGLL